MDLYRAYMGGIFNKFMNKKKFMQIRIPTEQFANELKIDPELFIKNMNNAYDIDYEQLKQDCMYKLNQIDGTQHVCIRTGIDCELHLSMGDRKWSFDAGDGDLPCGEIGIAPIEEETNGRIYFEKIKLDDGLFAENVIINIENGEMKYSNSEEFNSFLSELPPKGNIVAEFAIGMNKNITEMIGFEGLDEKMFGTFHIGIGMNIMDGGKNDSPIHMDFVGKGDLVFS